MCVSAVRVLRPAGGGGRLAFVAVQESGRDDQQGAEEEDAVGSSREQCETGAQRSTTTGSVATKPAVGKLFDWWGHNHI